MQTLAGKKGGTENVQERDTDFDQETLERAIAGDQPAFRDFVVFYQGRVFSLLWRMLSPGADRAVVEDLTQETFLNVFRGRQICSMSQLFCQYS